MFKIQFEKSFLMLVKDLKKALKSDIFDRNTNNETLRTPALKYIASVRESSQLKIVEELVNKYDDMNLHWLENQFFEAIYIDSNHDYNAIFITAKKEHNSLDSEKLNYGNDSIMTTAIQKTILEKNIESLANFGFDTTVNIIYAFELSIAKSHSISMDELHYIKMSNTQKEIVKNYNLHRTDPDYIKSYDFNNYDHLRSFSLNYYAMVRVMSDVYKREGKNNGFTVHDAGTSNSQLALMLSTLKEDELMGLKVNDVIASDLVLACQDKTLRYICQYENSKPITFVQQDFTDESRELPKADVTILNDVLEHFPTDELSFHIMERFWNRTGKLLIVHVPEEEEPGIEWGHYITFNREKLLNWAAKLSGHICLSDDYRFNENIRYSDSGFLILKRID